MQIPSLTVVTFVVVLLTERSLAIRKGKTLIFPPTAPTRVQLIYGIGIPLPLEYESMTTGYVLKAEYFLPTTAKEFRPLQLTPQPVNKRDVNSRKNDTRHVDDYEDETTLRYLQEAQDDMYGNSMRGKYRWAVYRAVETLTDRMGLHGRSCMLRAICEAAETPFHSGYGLFEELLHIVMTPSSSTDKLSKHSDNEYFHAEQLGRAGAPCDLVFKDCKLSLLSIFSGTYNPITDALTRILASQGNY